MTLIQIDPQKVAQAVYDQVEKSDRHARLLSMQLQVQAYDRLIAEDKAEQNRLLDESISMNRGIRELERTRDNLVCAIHTFRE